MAEATPAAKAPAKKAAAKKAAPVTVPTAPLENAKVLVEPVGTPAIDTLSVPSIKLPNWADGTSITAFIMSLVVFVLGILTVAHVTVPSGTSNTASTWAGIAGVAIAAGVQGFNWIRVTVLHKAAINNGVKIVTKPVKP